MGLRDRFLFVCGECDRQTIVTTTDSYVIKGQFCVDCSNMMKAIAMPNDTEYIQRMVDEKIGDDEQLPDAYDPQALYSEVR